MQPTYPRWPTLGELSRRTGIPTYKLRYVAKRLNLKPAGVAGGTYVYTEADADYIVSTCRRIERDKKGGRL